MSGYLVGEQFLNELSREEIGGQTAGSTLLEEQIQNVDRKSVV